MNDNDLLALIALVTTITTIIQTIEMYLLLKSNRKTNDILENPGKLLLDGAVDMVDGLTNDAEAAQAFFTLIANMGKVAYNAAVTSVKEGAKEAIDAAISSSEAAPFLDLLPKKYRRAAAYLVNREKKSAAVAQGKSSTGGLPPA